MYRLTVSALLLATLFVACASDERQEQPSLESTNEQPQSLLQPLTATNLAGMSVAEMLRELYERNMAEFPSVCAYVLDTGVRGLAQPLEPATLPPETVAELVGGWTGSIWIGQFSDYELAWTEQKRIVLVSTEGVPPPHQGFYETVGNALEFVRIHGDWELHVIGRLFDCQDSSAPLPDGIGTLARRLEGAAGYFSYEVEEAVEDEQSSDDRADHWYSIL